MALSQSVLSDLLDAFRAGEGVDLVRDAVRMVMQELIEAEATEQIGAARYERINTRVTERNGSRPRLVATQAGDIELRIPKLRKGSFFPSILEPRRRIDPLRRRPGRRVGCRLGDLQVGGVTDLCWAG
jgi:putative transposase